MELTSFKTKFKIYFSSLILAVILLFSIFMGISKGQKIAQSERVFFDSTNLAKALDYFYADQDRYPTQEEFASKTVMLNYTTNFPAINFPSSSCTQSISYKRISAQNYELDFCLPTGLKNLDAGWHSKNQ